jgi:hypothetical protein
MLCNLCPRQCNAIRTDTQGSGVCGMPDSPVLSRAALHFWEEPSISGTKGSGTVFFTGCSLHCVYCQNNDISANNKGKSITTKQLADIFKRLENDDLEAYETLHSGYRLLTNDYISEIRKFTRNNIHYNNILRKYLGIQKRILEEIKEGDVIPTGLFIDFIRRTQLMRRIEFYNRYPLMTYEYTFEDGYPYIGDLTSLKDKLLEYRKENPMIEIDKDKIKLMEHLTNYTVPEEDNNYDIAARDELLSKADDLSKRLQRII